MEWIHFGVEYILLSLLPCSHTASARLLSMCVAPRLIPHAVCSLLPCAVFVAACSGFSDIETYWKSSRRALEESHGEIDEEAVEEAGEERGRGKRKKRKLAVQAAAEAEEEAEAEELMQAMAASAATAAAASSSSSSSSAAAAPAAAPAAAAAAQPGDKRKLASLTSSSSESPAIAAASASPASESKEPSQ